MTRMNGFPVLYIHRYILFSDADFSVTRSQGEAVKEKTAKREKEIFEYGEQVKDD